jgi:hypothetical protein
MQHHIQVVTSLNFNVPTLGADNDTCIANIFSDLKFVLNKSDLLSKHDYVTNRLLLAIVKVSL